MKILIIEDHPQIRNNVIKLLKLDWYIAEGAIHWEEGLQKCDSNQYDVIILDVNMPVMNGLEFTKSLRAKNNPTPIIALTSNSMLQDKLELFDLWVDDYLTKPFEIEELKVRLRALSKRWQVVSQDIHNIWDIQINLSSHKIILRWEEILFQNKQYHIIEYLVKNRWYPKKKLEIMEYAWWETEEALHFNTVALESQIYLIRKQLWKDFIKTIKGIWYIID